MRTNKNQVVKTSLAGLMVAAFLCAGLQEANAASTVATWDFTGTWTSGLSPTITGTPGTYVSAASMTTLITDNGSGTPSIARQSSGGQSGAYMRFTDNTFVTSYPARFTLTLTATANMSSFSISYYARGSSATTMATDTWSYSINGGTFTDFANPDDCFRCHLESIHRNTECFYICAKRANHFLREYTLRRFTPIFPFADCGL